MPTTPLSLGDALSELAPIAAAPHTEAPEPKRVYAMFAGQIDQAAVQRIIQGLTGVMANGVTDAHLLLQSFGGMVGDGVCLYNIFRALPIDLTLYNVGNVASIASIAYLGAKKRKTSAYAMFMIHRTNASPQFATANRLQSVTKAVVLDDQRTEAILRQHITFSDDQWKELEYHDLTFSAQEAVKIGLADEVAEFSPPPGTQVFSV